MHCVIVCLTQLHLRFLSLFLTLPLLAKNPPPPFFFVLTNLLFCLANCHQRFPNDAEESSSYGLGEDGKFIIDSVEVTNSGVETISFKHWEIWSAEYLATSSPTQWVRVQEGPLLPLTEMNDLARLDYSSNFIIEEEVSVRVCPLCCMLSPRNIR
jgi:hypothetical protein